MKSILFFCVAAAGVVACGPAVHSSMSAGSLALSKDQKTLYAVDTDNNLLSLIDTRTFAVVATTPLGSAPERIVVAPDGTAFVSNRGGRSVSVVQPGTWQETARIPVGVEPVGLALSADARTLYVVNGTTLQSPTQGSLMAIDVQTHAVQWEAPVGEEPRGVALLDAHTAAVTLFKQGDVVLVDLDHPTQAPQSLGASIYGQLNASKGSNSGGFVSFSSFRPRSFADVVVSPDQTRAYVTSVLTREDPIALPPSVAHPYYEGGGPCNIGGVATPALITLDAVARTPLTDDLTSCAFSGLPLGAQNHPPTTLASSDGSTPIQGPQVAAVDSTNTWVFVVNRESNNVAIVPAQSLGNANTGFSGSAAGLFVTALVPVGRAPNGIALTADGKRAYIYNSFDHTVSTLAQDGAGDVVEVGSRLVVAADPPALTAEVLAGRRLFFDATDPRMNALSVGVSCNTCHSEGGREDGHTWGFPDGPRQTPSLAGRMVLQTAPYHWTGAFPDLPTFLDHTITTRMGGSGVGTPEHQALAAYISALALPENPLRLATPTAAQARGALVFAQAQCNSCHAGVTMTNNGFANVDVSVSPLDQIPANGLNTPSLLGLGRTAPFLHDGSAATLEARIAQTRNTSLHGNLTGFTDAQVSDLVSYLYSL